MIEEIVDILKEFQAHKGAKITLNSMSTFEKRPGVNDIITIQKPNILEGTLSKQVEEDKFQKIAEKISEKNIYSNLDIQLPIGTPFKNYGEFDNVFSEAKTVLSHQEGEVLLVDVWATWCPPCQAPMAHNQDMLMKNAEIWKDRVRIVGISVDEEKQTIKQRINSKKWHSVQHLTLLGWKGDHQFLKDFRVQGIPFVCLVDREGKINYAGHPSEISLEDRINELMGLGEKKVEKEEGAGAIEAISKQEIQKVKQCFRKESLQNILNQFYLCSISFKQEDLYQNQNKSCKITVSAATSNSADTDKLKTFLKQFQGIELKIETAPYIDVPLQESPNCWKCQKNLVYPYYWLRWQEGNKFGCRECVQAKSTQEGHIYAYEQNSVLLLGKWQKISEKSLGKNKKPENLQNAQHYFGCNACGGNSGKEQPRYLCLGCRADPNPKRDYCDLCVGCLQKLIKGEQQVLNSLKPDNHVLQHPWLRILYGGNYYDF